MTARRSSNPSDKTDDDPTRLALLEAADSVFGALGFDGASVREITNRAGANLAAISYHFGSKEGLFEAAIRRHLRKVNGDRLTALTALGPSPSVEAILDAFFRPAARHLGRSSPVSQLLQRLFARVVVDAEGVRRRIARDEMAPLYQAFTAALRTAVPGLDAERAIWALHFSNGSLMFTFLTGEAVTQLSAGAASAADLDRVVDLLVVHASAGIRALGAMQPPTA